MSTRVVLSGRVAGLLQMEWQLSKFMAELEDDHWDHWAARFSSLWSVGFWPSFYQLRRKPHWWLLARSIQLEVSKVIRVPPVIIHFNSWYSWDFPWLSHFGTPSSELFLGGTTSFCAKPSRLHAPSPCQAKQNNVESVILDLARELVRTAQEARRIAQIFSEPSAGEWRNLWPLNDHKCHEYKGHFKGHFKGKHCFATSWFIIVDSYKNMKSQMFCQPLDWSSIKCGLTGGEHQLPRGIGRRAFGAVGIEDVSWFHQISSLISWLISSDFIVDFTVDFMVETVVLTDDGSTNKALRKSDFITPCPQQPFPPELPSLKIKQSESQVIEQLWRVIAEVVLLSPHSISWRN